jgi:uncharacterized SAM-binding protein YcdF (DUF218 family)
LFTAAFGILGVLSLVYFGIIAVYSGIETSAAWIWPVFAAVCFLLAKGDRYYHQHRRQVPLWIPVSVATLCITGFVVLMILQILIFGGMIKSAPSHLDYLIVLGAKVREDDISSSLKRRLDKAIRYAQEHPETKLVLSGGQGEDEPTSEALAMAEYLLYNGISPDQMLLEVYSTNTRENMLCSKALIDNQRKIEKEAARQSQIRKQVIRMELAYFLKERERQWEAAGYTPSKLDMRGPCAQAKRVRLAPAKEPSMAALEILPDKPLQIGVLTSNFHLFRAMKIGEKCGFDQLYGVSSSADPVLFIHLLVRESIAILKDKFMGNM